VFGKSAEACNQYLKKGSRVLVVGELTPDKATGNPRVYQKKDGTSAANFEVNASTVRFLSHKEQAQESQDLSTPREIEPEDDIPF
jgi:single-strand DNA-binding protein